MISTNDIQTASKNVRAKARQTRAFERGEYVLVAPRDESRVLRTVVFLPDDKVLCVNATTGEPCPANEFHQVCYHAQAALRRKEINRKRRETLKAKGRCQ